MNAVPVLAGGNGHTTDGEILVELVKGGGTSTPAGYGYAGADLHGLTETRTVEQPNPLFV